MEGLKIKASRQIFQESCKQRFDENSLESCQEEIKQLKSENTSLSLSIDRLELLLNNQRELDREKDGLHKLEVDSMDTQLKSVMARGEKLAQIAD
jgi:hypothetical protein